MNIIEYFILLISVIILFYFKVVNYTFLTKFDQYYYYFKLFKKMIKSYLLSYNSK